MGPQNGGRYLEVVVISSGLIVISSEIELDFSKMVYYKKNVRSLSIHSKLIYQPRKKNLPQFYLPSFYISILH